MPDPKKIKAPEALQRMLQRYAPRSLQEYKNAIKEIAQEIALLGLWRSKFFEKAAFYGGTALRILHQLDRFSEDLGFSLLKPDPTFDIAHYEKAVQEELTSLGFVAEVKKKEKTTHTSIDSAFIKINTLQHLLLVGMPAELLRGSHADEIMKIRFEVDIDPPADGAVVENVTLMLPNPFSIKTLRLEDLFAGKAHAALCRQWKGRVKGRDWYDLVWFVSREIPLNLNYLEQRMRQSGYWDGERKLTQSSLRKLFAQKIQELDIASAREDIINFIDDSSKVDLWSKDFFLEVTERIRIMQ